MQSRLDIFQGYEGIEYVICRRVHIENFVNA